MTDFTSDSSLEASLDFLLRMFYFVIDTLSGKTERARFTESSKSSFFCRRINLWVFLSVTILIFAPLKLPGFFISTFTMSEYGIAKFFLSTVKMLSGDTCFSSSFFVCKLLQQHQASQR